MTRLIHTLEELRQALPGPDQSIGFVATMGALHAGHKTLLTQAVLENAFSVMSIFVNPTQFNNEGDLTRYPRDLDSDLAIAREAGVDVVFAPETSEIYPPGDTFRISESFHTGIMEGLCRPGHFDGMLTVVLKLLLIIRPQRTYFGEKDYQQLALVKALTKAFFLPTEVIGCPTLREASGLAMSSRNRLLSPEQLSTATLLYRRIREEADSQTAMKLLSTDGFDVEYVEEWNGRRYVAAKLGEVRLIDNIAI